MRGIHVVVDVMESITLSSQVESLPLRARRSCWSVWRREAGKGKNYLMREDWGSGERNSADKPPSTRQGTEGMKGKESGGKTAEHTR